eukprot:jgi/Hompol1/2404/HPOL_005987-RA
MARSGSEQEHNLQCVFVAATLAPVKTDKSRVPRAIMEKLLRGNVQTIGTESLHRTSDQLDERFIRMPQAAEESRQVEIKEKLKVLKDIIAESVDQLATMANAKDAQPGTNLTKWIVFCRSNSCAQEVHEQLESLIESTYHGNAHCTLTSVLVHSDMDRIERAEQILQFAFQTKPGQSISTDSQASEPAHSHIHILVSTDVVSRGVDFQGVTRIVHFDFPTDAVEYVHRCGRAIRATTGRGSSIAFVMARNAELAECIEEASKGVTGVQSARLLNHRRYANSMDMDLDDEKSTRKHPLTGIISRKRSFSK